MKRTPAGLALLMCSLLTACGGSSTPGSPATATQPAPTATSASSSATPTSPTSEEDYAKLQKAQVSAADIGRPWVQDAKPRNTTPKGGDAGAYEFCPGHITATSKVKYVAASFQGFKEGKTGTTAGFSLFTMNEADWPVMKSGWRDDVAACAEQKTPDGYYIVLTPEGPETVKGADEVIISYASRIYQDKSHKNLLTASHYLVTRTGRAFSHISYNNVVSTKDPKGKDFATVTRLMEKQLAKLAKGFSG